ncbi:hypothetical protein [Geomicrobium sediminis]|uniref:Uncharacterized protein n=1 Tax=Geomicrobium sediminis TaxID=1347788 RepID=A0ABS2P7V1_9BACL|nr:hypothetical protein [Geomicrobium sediminis]MBM7631392.1 hypothetical protein [Geomicrobium sediminis]
MSKRILWLRLPRALPERSASHDDLRLTNKGSSTVIAYSNDC